MKVKLLYKKSRNNGVLYKELPDDWYNRDIINIPSDECLAITASEIPDRPTNTYLTFQHKGFIKVGKEIIKVIEEI